MADIPRFELNTGAKIASVGLGTWQAEPGKVGEAVKTAIKGGYRLIDCAKAYFNQKEIGDALQQMFKEGIVKREDLWITSKLWNTDHAREDVPKALDETLSELQIDYLDLYLVHWPVALKKGTKGANPTPEEFEPLDIKGTWQGMEKAYESGKTKAIGISNFSVEKTKDLLSYAKVIPAVNQVECHPMWQQRKLHPFLAANNIHLTAYSPIGSSGSSFVHANVLDQPVLKTLASKYGKTPAQIALRWNVQMGSSVIPKSTSTHRLKENLDIFDFTLSSEDIKEFNNIEQVRLLRGDDMWINDTTSPYKSAEELWDGDI